MSSLASDFAGSGGLTVSQVAPPAGTVVQKAITVGTTAVRCTVSGSSPISTRSRLFVTPDPASTANFFIGASTVASSGANRGTPIAPGEHFASDFDAGDYYIISDTVAQTFFITEQY
jgi:hypothetical protein